ncbi:MAG: hypothetical protein FWC73_01250 [Defluviitaleaceae bacterium]|nr:hypothetical protein [Defluviitaleaceae bacterium]
MKRFAIYAIMFLLLGAVIYIFAFFRPNANRIEDLERSIIAAELELINAAARDEMYPILLMELEALNNTLNSEEGQYIDMSNLWAEGFLRFMPDAFYEEDMRRRIDGIVHPNVENLHVEIYYSQPLTTMNHSDQDPYGLPRGIWQTPVGIYFYATYEGLINVLTNFANGDFDNRINGYEIERDGERWRVSLRVDILTQTPPRYRFNGNYILEDGVE